MTNSSQGFFDTYSGGGGGAPSFKFEVVGDRVRGTVLSTKEEDQTHYSGVLAGKPIEDPKRPGQYKKQLRVILQTNLRNWDGVTKVPTDGKDGPALPASEDTGTRAIYVKGWMIGAISDAMHKATSGARRHVIPGDELIVKLIEAHDKQKQNPKKFSANARPAAEGSDMFTEAEEEQTASAVNAAHADSMSFDDDEGDEHEAPF